MKLHQKMIYMVVIGLLWLGGAVTSVSAESLSFNVKPVYPENQLDKDVTYFHLQTTPNMEQTLTIEVTNVGSEPLTIEGLLYTATTNSLGVIEYGESLTEIDETVPMKLTDVATLPQAEMTIAPETTEAFPIHIQMPEKSFGGILLGGITIQEKDDEKDEDKSKEKTSTGAVIKNKFNYRYVLMLEGTEPHPEPEVKLTNVTASLDHERNAFISELQNPNALLLHSLSVKSEVRKKGESSILYQDEIQDGQLAPNSTLNFPVFLKGDKFEPGTYNVKCYVSAEGQQWELEQDVTINEETAKKVNQKSVDIPEKDYTMWYVASGIVVAIVIIIIVYKMLHHRKKKK
ncbi:DUF916 and DUF3324 domain-containing protein [Vagococcus lutrae]|uniref:DUF916 and DUF3324 domain-containing protein n=1 Tax=Vagococcus lutrae TaxID=81947 RepID=UPI00288FBD02|nr:DUF916 and DUF3324 domain-containing protein [Vagococcus lutrae]MDT2801581.1 DUF916 and DUF3324 domain-containing protein [Vagococcus lutrae]